MGDWPDEKGPWQRWLLRGGFPPVLATESDRDRGLWFAAYVQTYLERDLRQLSDVASLPDFQRLMVLAAYRTGKLLNQADLARDAALSHPTAHRYLNLFYHAIRIFEFKIPGYAFDDSTPNCLG